MSSRANTIPFEEAT